MHLCTRDEEKNDPWSCWVRAELSCQTPPPRRLLANKHPSKNHATPGPPTSIRLALWTGEDDGAEELPASST